MRSQPDLRQRIRIPPVAAGQAVSELGSSASRLTIPTVGLLVFHLSALEIGLLQAVQFLVFPLTAPAAGSLFDRRPTRSHIVLADLLRAAVLLALALSIATGGRAAGLLFLAAFIVGTLDAVFTVGFRSLVPLLVGEERLASFNSALIGGTTAGDVGGQGVAGALFQFGNGAVAFAADGASYLVSFLSLLLGGFLSAPMGTAPRPSQTRKLRDGARVIRDDAVLRTSILCAALINFGGSAVMVSILVLVYDRLALAPIMVGGVFAAGGLGAVAAVGFASRLSRKAGTLTVLRTAVFAYGAGCALVLVSLVFPPLPVLFLCFLFFSGAQGVASVLLLTIRQQRSPRDLLGRINALALSLLMGCLGIGSIVGGALSNVTPSLGVLVGAGVCVVGAAVVRPRPGLQAQPAPSTFLGSLEALLERRPSHSHALLDRWSELISEHQIDLERLRSTARGPRAE